MTLLIGKNEAYQINQEGNFNEAINKLDRLMDADPEYPGLAEGYRTSKFWSNRTEEIENLTRGKQTADFLMREWRI